MAGKERDKPSVFSARRLGLAVLAALVLVLALRLFVVRSYRVSSHAMSETILPGDWVLVSRLSYNFGVPRRGDVVCFTSPGAGGRDFFGRVIYSAISATLILPSPVFLL